MFKKKTTKARVIFAELNVMVMKIKKIPIPRHVSLHLVIVT